MKSTAWKCPVCGQENGSSFCENCGLARPSDEELDVLKERAKLKRDYPTVDTKTGMDMSFAQISIFHDDISITYLVPSNEAANEVLQTAFGKDADYDGVSYRLEPGISRKQVLVPAITDILASDPKDYLHETTDRKSEYL